MIRRHPWGGLADPQAPPPSDVVVLGLPYDAGVCYRAGAARAPGRLREISSSSPAISEEGFVVQPAELRVRDLGDIEPAGAPGSQGAPGGPGASKDGDAAARDYFARVERAVADVFRRPAPAGRDPFLLTIGGDHSVNIPLVRGFGGAFPDGFGLISLDAHPDLFEAYDGSPLSHACPMRRALDGGRLRSEHLVILGTRSYNEVEIDFMRERRIRFVPARELDRIGAAAAVALARERLEGVSSVYLTIDIDVADPACAPGTGAPVAGGMSSRQVLELVRGLVEGLPVRAMDLVEVAPPLDPSDITLYLALQIVFETFAALAKKRRVPRHA